MKKNLWMAALVGVALTGCVNEESSPLENQAKALSFAAPVMKTQSRANVLGEIDETAYPTNEDFKVYSWNYSGAFTGWGQNGGPASFFDKDGEIAKHGFSVDGNAKYWNTDKVYYWPDPQYKLMFAAYSPAEFTPKVKSGDNGYVAADGATDVNAKVSYDSKGLNIENFKVQKNSNLQYDLLYSDRNYDRTESNNGNSAVKLQFNHALSSIVFSAQKGTDIKYEITDLKIGGDFIMEGNFSQGITENYNGETQAYSETSTPTWTFPQSPERLGNTDVFEPEFESFEVPLKNPTQFTKGTSALLMIPQDVPTKKNSAEEAYVIVSYTVTQNEKSIDYTTPKIPLSKFTYIDENDGNEVKVIDKWLPGIRYIYRIAFGVNKQIYFEPAVTDWEDHPVAVYTIQ